MNSLKTGRRSHRTGSNYDQASVDSNSYREYSGSKVTSPGGWCRDEAGTQLHDASAGKAVKPGTNLAIYNNAATVAFVTFYLSSGSTPAADSTTGVPVPPNSYLYLNSHNYDRIISSAATVLIYPMIDESNYQVPT